jgi:hypothetical protein
MSKITQNILWALGIIFVVMLVIPRNCSTGNNGVVSDTTRVLVYDTVKIVKPIPKDSTIVRYVTEVVKVIDTELVTDCHGLDSIKTETNCHQMDSDSIAVEIPITQKVYEDSTYTAYVSGYKPSLDSLIMRMPNTTTTIVKTNERSRWSISVHGGYGLTLTKQPRFEPYIGIGISYNLYTFPKLRKRLKK